MTSTPQISIQVPSNRPEQIIKFIDAYESAADDPTSFEILVNIDKGDAAMAQLLEDENAKRKTTVKYMSTFDGGFYDSWVFINDLMRITNPASYFLLFLSDEMMVKTKGWDTQIKQMIGYYPDDIFRLRCSQFRYHNYTDIWQCGSAPDSICFTTRKWVEINGGDWASCFSSDAFQQCVAYYLITADPFIKEQQNRDIPMHSLTFKGEGTNIGLPPEKQRRRIQGGIIAWMRLMSYPMQLEAKRRAMHLRAHITASEKGWSKFEVKEDASAREVTLAYPDDPSLNQVFSYQVNALKLWWYRITRWRNYLMYAGGGNAWDLPFLHGTSYYLAKRYDRFETLNDTYNHRKARFDEWWERNRKRFGLS